MSPEGARPRARSARVVLGVSGGIAAYKACELLRRFTESGHDVTVVPTAAALEFVGAPTWAALSGKPVSSEVWTDVHAVPHVADRPERRPRRRRARDRRPAGQGRPRAGRRPADQHPADRPLPGRVRAGDAHRDVGAPGHRGQRRHAARARRDRDRAGRGTPDRQGHRQGPPARPGRDLRHRARRARPRRRRARPGRPPRGRQRRRHPRVPRPGALPRQPLVRPAGLRPGPSRGRARRRGHPDRRQRGAARPGRRQGRRGRDHRPAARRRRLGGRLRRRGRDGCRARRLPADLGQRGQDQEGRGRFVAGHRARAEPRHPQGDLAPPAPRRDR